MTIEIIIQAIVSGLLMGFIYALIAAGLSLIFGLMGIVNFAHGEHLMLSMFSSFWLWTLLGLDPIISIPITMLILAISGVLTHYLLIRYILNAKMLVQICATFGLSIFLRSLAQFLWTPDFRYVANPLLEGRLEIAGIFIGQPQFYASLVCLLSFLLLYLFVNKSEIGLALQATAQDREAAETLGININKTDDFKIETQKEISLSKMLLEFPDVIVQISEELEPHHITKYTLDLASEFHSYYQSEKIIDEDNLNNTISKLILCKAIQKTLKKSSLKKSTVTVSG